MQTVVAVDEHDQILFLSVQNRDQALEWPDVLGKLYRHSYLFNVTTNETYLAQSKFYR
jgi:hypothetical protein